MKLLLDTHIVLGMLDVGASALPSSLLGLVNSDEHEHHFSVASLWEIAIKWRLGKLRFAPDIGELPRILDELGIARVAIDERHALTEVQPEPSTRDPFDRMLLAQCAVDGMKLVTLDRALVSHPLAAQA